MNESQCACRKSYGYTGAICQDGEKHEFRVNDLGQLHLFGQYGIHKTKLQNSPRNDADLRNEHLTGYAPNTDPNAPKKN